MLSMCTYKEAIHFQNKIIFKRNIQVGIFATYYKKQNYLKVCTHGRYSYFTKKGQTSF